LTDLWRAAIFSGIVLGIAFGGMVGLIRACRKRRLSGIDKLCLVAGCMGCLCVAYGYWIEPYWPEITHIKIPTPKLAAGSHGIRLALISDLHSDVKPRLEPRLPSLIAAEHPDAILFTGDSVNDPAALRLFRECMSALARVAPTFAVRGNWDTWIWPGLNLFGGTGVRELRTESIPFTAQGHSLWMAGAPADAATPVQNLLKPVPAGALTVFLHHYPYPRVLVAADQARVDLFVAGHVHGGQVALPFYGALITFSEYGKTYERGLYSVGSMKLYVNRGIGMEGGPTPRVRFCARPEITIIDFVPA
jgi:predicted MPP superfamily phosphohydrolase